MTEKKFDFAIHRFEIDPLTLKKLLLFPTLPSERHHISLFNNVFTIISPRSSRYDEHSPGVCIFLPLFYFIGGWQPNLRCIYSHLPDWSVNATCLLIDAVACLQELIGGVAREACSVRRKLGLETAAVGRRFVKKAATTQVMPFCK